MRHCSRKALPLFIVGMWYFMALSSLALDAVDFAYSFATPHRVTIGRPENSDRTLLDLQPGNLRMSWTYEDLTTYPIGSFKTPPTAWNVTLTPQIDGEPFPQSSWTRLEGSLPSVANRYEDPRGEATLTALGGITAALVRVDFENADTEPHRFVLRCEAGSWAENRAWCDPDRWPGDSLVCGWNERADRLMLLGVGAQTYSMREDRRSEGPKTLTMVWDLAPGERAEGWLVRPYRAVLDDMPALQEHPWDEEFDAGRREWRSLLRRADRYMVPDEGVRSAFLACFADLWIMREPIAGGYIGCVPGTEVYRATNSAEGAILAIALDQAGFHEDAARGLQVNIDMQGSDGDWSDPEGWAHTFWAASGFKAYALAEHVAITGDLGYLRRVYPNLSAAARCHDRDRQRTRGFDAPGERPLTYGLLPRGFGDCGLLDDGDTYGVFLPHNIWAVYCDRVAWEAAEALGETTDAAELRRIYETAHSDLLQALDRGAIAEDDIRWIPGVPGKTSGSRWGALNALAPCRILDPDHELIDGTIRKLESQLSEGGLPLNTGWLENGLWVAIALDNLAECHLLRGDGDFAARYLLATLNHATPLVTWCEERTPEPGATHCTGDRQHLWTPVSVVRAMRDMMVLEREGGLDLALGIPREWLATGGRVGVTEAPTHYGPVSYQMRYDRETGLLRGSVRFPSRAEPSSVTLHLRLPEGWDVADLAGASGPEPVIENGAMRWSDTQGVADFTVRVNEG